MKGNKGNLRDVLMHVIAVNILIVCVVVIEDNGNVFVIFIFSLLIFGRHSNAK